MLATFEIWSSLRVNFDKSQIIFLGQPTIVNNIVGEIIRNKIGDFLIHYLGVPINLKN